MDSVTWRKDGVEIGPEFNQTQKLPDALSATYKHTLSSKDLADFIGNFSCEVEDRSGNINNRTIILNGTFLHSCKSTQVHAVPLNVWLLTLVNNPHWLKKGEGEGEFQGHIQNFHKGGSFHQFSPEHAHFLFHEQKRVLLSPRNPPPPTLIRHWVPENHP